MKRAYLTCMIVCVCVAQQAPPRISPGQEPDVTLPNGRSQREAIVKDDYKRNLEEATELVKIAGELKYDLENGDKYIVSIKAMKKTEDIERLAKSIRSRMKRY